MKKRYKKIRCKYVPTLLICWFVVMIFTINISAEKSGMPEGFDALPEHLEGIGSEYIDRDFFSDDLQEVGQAVGRMSESEFWLNVVFKALGDELSSSLKLLVKLCGFLILVSIFGTLCRSTMSDSLSGAVRFCTTTAIFAAIIHMQSRQLEAVGLFFERILGLMGAMIPITGTVWAMGGNITTASSGTSALYLTVNVCQGICANTVVPVCYLFTAFALCNTLSPDMGLRGLSGALKKIYTFLLTLIMTVLMASLAAQTTLSAASDCTAARAAKLVSSNVIPMVGASVGDTFRTIATSAQYMKSVVGIGGIILVALLLIPTLSSLIMTRLVFLLSSGVADILGCDTESRFLSELGGVYAIMIAVVSMSSVMFIFALTVFLKTVVAIA